MHNLMASKEGELQGVGYAAPPVGWRTNRHI